MICVIYPPFNSDRTYHQLYLNQGKEDKAQAQAFTDTWTWNDAAIKGYSEICSNTNNVFTKQCIEIISGFKKALGDSPLMAYIISMALRIAEIHRVLKDTGGFYLHCDPMASHYIKLVMDSIFCANQGEYRNEIIWKRQNAKGLAFTRFALNHDVIFYYTKTNKFVWNPQYKSHDDKYVDDFYKYTEPDTGRVYSLADLTNPNKNRPNLNYEFLGITRVWRWTKTRMEKAYNDGLIVQTKADSVPRLKRYLDEQEGTAIDDIWIDILPVQSQAKESLGYPTQKPESLLERIIQASSNEGDLILDAYCGCGTSIAVAQRLKRKWIGIDITYQSISVILKRLKEHFGQEIIDKTELNGVPKDMDSAVELAHKKDDRVRKEFEKWAVLTYSDNKAIINEKKGADSGIDGIAFMLTGHDEHKQVLFSVKSGSLTLSMIRDFCHVVDRENAAMGIFITLEEPTKPMLKEVKALGSYMNPLTNQEYPKIEIVTIDELLKGKRLNLPQAIKVLKDAESKKKDIDESQMRLL